MKNPCRELRQLLKLNQVEFARLIGRSYQSLKVYEKHPEDTPPEIIESLKSIAAANGHADWAVFLSSDEWRITNVLQPGEELISAHTVPKSDVPAGAFASAAPDRAQLHHMLDAILDSKDPDAIRAVVPNLELFYKWVQKRGTAIPAKKRRA
jgi:DNA-binding XRE family transcriptional regulator